MGYLLLDGQEEDIYKSVKKYKPIFIVTNLCHTKATDSYLCIPLGAFPVSAGMVIGTFAVLKAILYEKVCKKISQLFAGSYQAS